MKERIQKLEKELKEAYSFIEVLRKQINETNLLNAKLLYTNKLFKDLQVKSIYAFDKCKTIKEVKSAYQVEKPPTVPTNEKE